MNFFCCFYVCLSSDITMFTITAVYIYEDELKETFFILSFTFIFEMDRSSDETKSSVKINENQSDCGMKTLISYSTPFHRLSNELETLYQPSSFRLVQSLTFLLCFSTAKKIREIVSRVLVTCCSSGLKDSKRGLQDFVENL